MAIVCLLGGGCASSRWASVREVPKSPLVDRLKLTAKEGPEPSPRTMQLLRRYALADQLEEDPNGVLRQLQEFIEREPTADLYFAFSELAFLGGDALEKKNPRAALDLYGASVAHAFQFMFAPEIGYGRNPYDPQFRGACDLYNGSLERTLRLVNQQGGLVPGSSHELETAGEVWQIDVVSRSPRWRSEDFDRFEFVSDFEVSGLTNHYHNYGLGVPLIAVYQDHPDPRPEEQFYPPDLSFPVSAFMRVVADSGAPATLGGKPRHRAVLELYDPLASQDTFVQGARIPLESDLTTPLAFFLDQRNLSLLGTIGLLRPDASDELRGLYMIQPYDPNKIPVVMVHGLWSSPTTWMEMFNDLRAAPELQSRYQFWFYLYPTGQPFWLSASQMRDDLKKVRGTLDPQGRTPALDHMVLVGHSMGGLVSRMQAVDSGDAFWKIVSDQPFEQVKADEEQRQRLEELFFFKANPSISRIITIGTPHRGSKFSNGATRWLGSKLIHLPEKIVDSAQLVYANNQNVFRNAEVLQVSTSIDSLAPGSPVLPVLLQTSHQQGVKLHNILGVIQQESIFGSIRIHGDGVVEYESGHMDNALSELVVNADHLSVHRHPKSILEVRRILLEHLNELDAPSSTFGPRVITASAQQINLDQRYANPAPSGMTPPGPPLAPVAPVAPVATGPAAETSPTGPIRLEAPPVQQPY